LPFRTVVRALFLVLATGSCSAGGSLSRVVPVRPCNAADSLLGQRGRDPKRTLDGRVYTLTQGPGLLLSGRFDGGHGVQARVESGHYSDPSITGTFLDIATRDATARAVQRFGRPVGGSLLVDDSLAFPLGLGTAGTYEGPAYLIRVIVRFRMPEQAFRALAHAASAAVLLTLDGPPVRFAVAEPDRRDIAALYVVTVCGAGRPLVR
jgi:hypothetical protein